MEAFHKMMEDVKIIEKNYHKPSPSNKVKKKALARIEKIHKRFVTSDGKSTVLANVYGFCAELILKGKINDGRGLCMQVILFQLRAWKENQQTDRGLFLSLEQIQTERGLILHVAKRVPCDCMVPMKQAAKKMQRTAWCQGCEMEKLFDGMLQCSGCKFQLYCSEDCQQKHWKKHKDACRSSSTWVSTVLE